MSQINVNTIALADGTEQARLVQVQSVNKADSFATASTTMVDVTGFSVAITPTNTANKILVMVQFQLGISLGGGYSVEGNLVRVISGGATSDIAMATGATNNHSVFAGNTATYNAEAASIIFLDAPNTTSATTYKLQINATSSGGTATFGRRGADTTYGSHSTITAMEIRT